MTKSDLRDGKLELGVCYYPEQWSPDIWRKDAQMMVDLGLDWVRIGEFTWSLIEPSPGEFNWDVLDQAVDILANAGLKIMFCTPTASPPKWLVDAHPDILPHDLHLRPRRFGSRRHYSFSSETYLSEARRITAAFGARYGANPNIHAWQIDNEYGDHDSIEDYGPTAAAAFRDWLAERYDNDIENLNTAWGTVFWSQGYTSFEQIDPPAGQLEEPNPGHAMDFQRFSSDQVARFHAEMVAALRPHVAGAPITHNFMANSYDFDHFGLSDDLDFASWDSYPMGHIVEGAWNSEEKQRYLRPGHPDYQAFHTALYRRVGNGRVWITEQQPGPVNWARFNQSPADGFVRNFTWSAYAAGCEAVLYFRWRQAANAHEQNHTALFLPDGTPDQAYHEVKQIVADRAKLPPLPEPAQADVALVIDYPSRWALKILPQGQRPAQTLDAMRWYEALRQFGVAVDIVSADQPLSGYKLVVCPDLAVESATLVDHVAQAGAKLLLNARSGGKSDILGHPERLAPGVFQTLLDVKVTRVESLPPEATDSVTCNGKTYPVGAWREQLETSETILAHFNSDHRDQSPAIIGNDRCRYFAFQPEGPALSDLMKDALDWAGVSHSVLNRDLRITMRGDVRFAINTGPDSVTLDLDNVTWLVGGNDIAPNSLSIWRS